MNNAASPINQINGLVPWIKSIMNRDSEALILEYAALKAAANYRENANKLSGTDETLAAIHNLTRLPTVFGTISRQGMQRVCPQSDSSLRTTIHSEAIQNTVTAYLKTFNFDREIAEELDENGHVSDKTRADAVLALLEVTTHLEEPVVGQFTLAPDQKATVREHLAITQLTLAIEAIEEKINLMQLNSAVAEEAKKLPVLGDLPTPDFNTICEAVTGNNPSERQL